MALPLIAGGLAGAGLFALPALYNPQSQPRLAGQGPAKKPQTSLPEGTPFVDSEGQLKIWGGPNYGAQSPESWAKLKGGQPNVNIEMGRARGSLPDPRQAPPLNLPNQPPVGETGTDYPAESSAAQKEQDPYLNALLDFLRKSGSPETVNALEEARLERLLRAQAELNRQSMEKAEELSRRQIEQTKINNWTALEQTRIEANLRSTGLVGQAMYLSAQPNVNTISAMNEGLKVALGPFQTKIGVRS